MIIGIPASILVFGWAVTMIFGFFAHAGDIRAPAEDVVVFSSVDELKAVVAKAVPLPQRPQVKLEPQRFRSLSVRPEQYPVEIPLSEKWQIVGSAVNAKTNEGFVLLDSGSRMFSLDASQCTQLMVALLEFECVFEGMRVTSFSGSGDRSTFSVGQAVTTAIKPVRVAFE